MKVIDLLNKIANGEEVPKKIKINDFDYYRNERADLVRIDFLYREKTTTELWLDFGAIHLNDEVEILEEPKGIPEKLYDCRMDTDNDEIEFLLKNINIIIDRYNDLLDYLESKGE